MSISKEQERSAETLVEAVRDEAKPGSQQQFQVIR